MFIYNLVYTQQRVIAIFSLCQYVLQFIAEDCLLYMPISRRFLWKKVHFPYFSRVLPLQVRQSLFTITPNNLQVAVFRQRSNIFQQSR